MSTRVETANGVIRGLAEDGIMSFRGIPFGAPPVGDLRFAPPAPPQPWSGERDCTRYGMISLQHRDPMAAMIPGCEWNFYHPGAVQGEDCLNLNIWTPGQIGSRPVLVWIHGGGCLRGSGTGLWSEGATFARSHDVVVVTINYRLGALGFLTLEDPQSELGYVSNAALLDQVAALRWVRENVSNFGGDPGRVCVFGQSAGAMSVSTLLGTPSAAGLFSRAIVQSGHADLYQDMDEARSVSRWFATKLGVPYDETTLATLRRVDATKLMSAQADLTSETPVPFTMVVDSHHLPIPPIDAIATGATASVPLMIGTNTDENKLFRALAWGPTVPPGGLSDRLAALFIDTTPQSERPAALVEHLLRTYQALAHGDDDAWDIVATDRMWRAPVWKLMDAYASAGGSVFSYEFALTTPVRGGILGACHALEIPFVFGNLRQPGVTEFIGDDITPGSVAASVSAMMNATWAEFARQGRPVHPDLPVWPEFKQGSRQQMCFSADTHLREDPCQARTLWWIEHERLLQPAFELWTRAGVSRRSNFIRSTGTR